MKIIILLISGYIYLFGFIDNDFDGVDDSIDMCLNTSFSDLVDKNGCPINKLYLGKLNLELIKEEQNNSNANTNIYLTYRYNNLLIDYSKDISHSSDSIIDIGYQFVTNDMIFKNYLGSVVDETYFFLSSVDYYFLHNFYTTFEVEYTMLQAKKETQLNYFNYNITLGYTLNQHNIELKYINSGSAHKTIGAYEGIDILYNYNISEKYYIKLGYAKSLKYKDDYINYFGFGVNFE